MNGQIDELAAEVSKEKKLRSRSEQYSKQLEEEIDILKVNIGKTSTSCYPSTVRSCKSEAVNDELEKLPSTCVILYCR